MAVSQVRELGRKSEATPRRVPVGHGEFFSLHCPIERLTDSVPAGFDQIVTHLPDDHVELRLRSNLGNPAAHEPASDHTHSFDIHFAVLLQQASSAIYSASMTTAPP